MARPLSDEKRAAIMAAATRVIASQGLAASTAAIAKEAGVSNGSLFTYFSTKAELLNQLYFELKSEMGVAAVQGLTIDGEARGQLRQLWRNWLSWAASSPEKRRAMAQLDVSDDVTAETRKAAQQTMGFVAALVERTRKAGPMRDAPLSFVAALVGSIADTTIDFMIAEPAKADEHCETSFEALRRMLT